MKSAFFLLASMILCCLHLQAQKEWSVWPGLPLGVRFTPDGPQTFSTPVHPDDPIKYVGGGVTYSDPQSGKELFTVTSRYVYNSEYQLLENLPLVSCSENRYAIQVVPFPDGSNRFYLFHTFPETGLRRASQSGLQTRCSLYGQSNGTTGGLRFSILDMAANGGRGRIIRQNVLLAGNIVDRIALVKHANGKDTWLVAHAWGSNAFLSYLVTTTGIQPAVVSNIGPVFSGDYKASIGEINGSPNGNLIAATSQASNLLELYNFDKASGTLSNYRSAALPGQPGNVCFSPDNSKLYVGSSETVACGFLSRVFQFDLVTNDLQQRPFKVFEGSGEAQINTQMARAPDGSIYLAGRLLYRDGGLTQSSLYRIRFPNQPRNACTIEENVVNTSYLDHFPNLVNDYGQQQTAENPITRLAMPELVPFCNGIVTLTAPAGFAEYRWSNGATGRTISVSQRGLYKVLAGPSGFNKPEAYGYTEVLPAGKTVNLGKDTTVCANNLYALQIPANFRNVLWQDGDTSSLRLVPRPGGKQMLSAIDDNGCQVIDSVCVFYKQPPLAHFGKDTTLCLGQELTLTLEPAANTTISPVVYNWQDGSKQQIFQVKSPGVFWGQVSFEGCTLSDTIKVDYGSQAPFSLGGDTTLCPGDSLQLSAPVPNARYQWNDGSSAPAIWAKNSGLYWLRINNGQCTQTDTIRVAFRTGAAIDLGGDTTVCTGTQLTLNAGNLAGNYRWQDGSTAPQFTATAPGLYRVQFSGDGCSVQDSIRVNWTAAPTLFLGNDTLLCVGQELSLQAPDGFSSIKWQDGSLENSFRVTSSGTFWVQAATNGCTRSDTIQIQYRALPQFSLGRDTLLCADQTFVLNPGINADSYRWQDGATTPTYRVQNPGTYSLTLSNSCGSTTDEIMVTAGNCALLLPNAFTPNADGLNDVFRVKNPHGLQSFRMQVFNRWGQTVFASTNPGQGWDGSYRGLLQPSGNYLYFVEAVDQEGKKVQLKGNVVLIR